MTIRVPLAGYGGIYSTLIDDADLDLINGYHWRAFPGHAGVFYAVRRIVKPDGSPTTQRMHQLITGWAQTDHVNGDGLDNRRSNLRPATSHQNGANRKSHRGSSSQFKGVSLHKPTGKWKVQIQVHGDRMHLGLLADEVEAARLYDRAALQHFGEFARPNFPEVR